MLDGSLCKVDAPRVQTRNKKPPPKAGVKTSLEGLFFIRLRLLLLRRALCQRHLSQQDRGPQIQ